MLRLMEPPWLRSGNVDDWAGLDAGVVMVAGWYDACMCRRLDAWAVVAGLFSAMMVWSVGCFLRRFFFGGVVCVSFRLWGAGEMGKEKGLYGKKKKGETTGNPDEIEASRDISFSRNLVVLRLWRASVGSRERSLPLNRALG